MLQKKNIKKILWHMEWFWWGERLMLKKKIQQKISNKLAIWSTLFTALYCTILSKHPIQNLGEMKKKKHDYGRRWPEPVSGQRLICGNQLCSLPGHSPLILNPRVQCWVTWRNSLPSCKSLCTTKLRPSPMGTCKVLWVLWQFLKLLEIYF